MVVSELHVCLTRGEFQALVMVLADLSSRGPRSPAAAIAFVNQGSQR